MDLFTHSRQEQISRGAPLAARMRPRTLEEFVGQEHVVGPGRLLRRAIQADQVSSLIFYGPPGTGKTTLAMVIANSTRSHFVTLNAVLTGVKDLRAVTKRAQEDLSMYGRRTTLFIDEVHRWNKAQQDALLPWVENGTIIMIGATTENPWFSVNRPLLSRSRVFQLEPLTEEDLDAIVRQALRDPERGYGDRRVNVEPNALAHLVNVSNGDARSLLNALELAVETTPPNDDDTIVVDMTVAEESIQQRAVLYDREGDYHFDTISAFIKSLRGSDPDAALYWLAKMVYAGEDPRFIFRRMLILASEDVGLADPNALPVVAAAAAAFERVGLPEGQFHLAEATLYLATTQKSNSVLGYFDALKVVKSERDAQVPSHLRDASRDKESFGHGQGYLYPHAYRDHWVAHQYLPEALQGQLFYQPLDLGYEREIKVSVERRREEQLAAAIEGPVLDQEILTYSPSDFGQERWLARTISGVGRSLGAVRDRIFAQLDLQRHHLILDLNAGSGLLTWEAIRRVPEGGVWCLARNEQQAELLQQKDHNLPEIQRPVVLQGAFVDLTRLLADAGHCDVLFDAIIGRNSLTQARDKAQTIRQLASLLRPGGRISLAEIVPRRGQRLYALIEPDGIPSGLVDAWQAAEEEIYDRCDDAMVNWDILDLRQALQGAGLEQARLSEQVTKTDRMVTGEQIDRWFNHATPGRPSYAMRLLAGLAPGQVDTIEELFRRLLKGSTVEWHSTIAFLTGQRPLTSGANCDLKDESVQA